MAATWERKRGVGRKGSSQKGEMIGLSPWGEQAVALILHPCGLDIQSGLLPPKLAQRIIRYS